MARKSKLEIFSKDDNIMVVLERDYSIHEVFAYVPALDSWHLIESTRLHDLAEKLVQEYIEENDIKLDESVDDLDSTSYRKFINNY